MPPGSTPSRRFSFVGTGQPQPQVFRPYGPPRLTSRSMNDAVIRASDAPRVRPRAVSAAEVFKSFAHSGLSFANAYGEYSQGVLEGLGESLKSAWSLVSHDMWQAKTWSELGTTALALGMMQPFNIAGGLADAYAMDARWGTHVAQRQLDIMHAITQLAADLPHWTPRQWGRAVGRLVGDILLAKGTGAALKAGLQGVSVLNKVAAVRYLAQYPDYANAFSEVKGFNFGIGQRTFKVQEALQWAKKGRWMSNQKLATSAETVSKMALDYPGARNFATQRWSVKRFGIYIEGTVAPQANPLGGGGHQLFRVLGKEGYYVEVPYK